MITGPLKVVYYDHLKRYVFQKCPNFKDPKIIKITSYERFSFSILRQTIGKIISIIKEEEKPSDISSKIAAILDQGKDDSELIKIMEYYQSTDDLKRLIR